MATKFEVIERLVITIGEALGKQTKALERIADAVEALAAKKDQPSDQGVGANDRDRRASHE